MNNFSSALWVELLKMRRSKVPLFIALGFSIAPLISGLFHDHFERPVEAQSMGLISTKAQLAAGTAEWSALFNMLAQATAVGGAIIFAIFTIWIFGREFADHTAKELLALPTSREAIVAAKFLLVAIWTFCLTLLCYFLGLIVGLLVVIPGWSSELFGSATVDILGAGHHEHSAITLRGIRRQRRKRLPATLWLGDPHGGYGSDRGDHRLGRLVPVVNSRALRWCGWTARRISGTHSYAIIILASLTGLAITFYWWRNADQTKYFPAFNPRAMPKLRSPL